MANLLEYKNNQIEAGEMTLFVGSNYVLSFRKNSDHRFTNVRDRCEREPDLLKMGPGYILYAILDEVVDRYFPLLNRIEDEMVMIEKEMFTKKDTKKLIEKLYQLKTQTTDLRHATIPLSEVLGKLHGGRVPTVCTNVQDYCNDIHNHLIRINKSIENFIIKSYEEKINKLVVVTGKGLHSQNEKNPYVSRHLSILKYSVPEFIENNSLLNKMIIEITDAKIEDGGSGAFYIYLKNKFKSKNIKE